MQSEVISPKPKSGQEAGHHLYLAAVSPIWMRCQLDSKQPHLPGRPPAPCNPPSSRHHLVNIFRTNLPPCRLFSWPSFYPPPSPPIHPLPWLPGHPPPWPICQGGGSRWNKVISRKDISLMPNLPQFATSSFYQDGQGKSLQDDIGIFEKVCFSRDIVGKYMCVDCIERQLSPKKNRLGGRGQKVPEFQSLIYHRSWVHSSARRCSMCRATEFSVHPFTCW